MALDKLKDILALQDVPAAIEFHVPEWNDTVFLKSPSANDRDLWEVYCQEEKGKPRKTIWRAKLAAMLLSDKDGKVLFTDPKDVEKLGEHSAAALHRIWERCLDLMKITEVEVDAMEKHSQPAGETISLPAGA
jgi:hypothetical protein